MNILFLTHRHWSVRSLLRSLAPRLCRANDGRHKHHSYFCIIFSGNNTLSCPPLMLSTPQHFPPPFSTPPCVPPGSFKLWPQHSPQETSLIYAIICIILFGDTHALSIVVAAVWRPLMAHANITRINLYIIKNFFASSTILARRLTDVYYRRL